MKTDEELKGEFAEGLFRYVTALEGVNEELLRALRKAVKLLKIYRVYAQDPVEVEKALESFEGILDAAGRMSPSFRFFNVKG